MRDTAAQGFSRLPVTSEKRQINISFSFLDPNPLVIFWYSPLNVLNYMLQLNIQH